MNTSYNQINFLVCVTCITYNHAPYIEDAMNGFCMQQTTFPFVAVIIDDASTDGEQKVIKSYLQTHFDMQNACRWETEDAYYIQTQHIENENCTFVVVLLKYNFFQIRKAKLPLFSKWRNAAKYIAICEGDDYWTKPDKLQQQIDLLETDKYGLVYTQASIYHENIQKMDGIWGKIANAENILFESSPIPTLTACFRKDLYLNYLSSRKNAPKWVLGDVPLWLFFINNSKIHFISQVTGVYRSLDESTSHSNDFYKRVHFVNGAYVCRQYYAEKYFDKKMARKVALVRIKHLQNLSFQFDKPLKLPLFRDMLKNRIFNVKLLILTILSNYSWGRHIVIKQRSLRVRKSL